MKFDIIKYSTHAAIGYGAFLAYDSLVLGYKLDGGFAMSDAGSFAMSSVIAYFTYEILSSLVPYLNENSFLGMISYPLLTGIVYSYVYEMNTGRRYTGIRDMQNAFVMGSIGCLLVGYIQSPILSLLGIKSY